MTSRNRNNPDNRDRNNRNNIGFRVCLVPGTMDVPYSNGRRRFPCPDHPWSRDETSPCPAPRYIRHRLSYRTGGDTRAQGFFLSPAMNPNPTENLPAHLALDLGSDVAMDFVRIEDGAFIMGSRGYSSREEPPHKVSISRPCYVARTPVTQQQMAQWTGSGDYTESWFPQYQKVLKTPHQNYFSNRPECPAESVTWYEAMGFCHWINGRNSLRKKLPPGYEASLPTEAQWEFFCRAGSQSEYCNGDGKAALKKVGHFNRSPDLGTENVGKLDPNAWGLYDLHGNVWEWCLDLFYEDTYREPQAHKQDPVAWNKELYHRTNQPRVLRGGSWFDDARYCRSSSRDRFKPDIRGRDWNVGFRVCLVPGPSVGRSDGKTC